MACIKDKKMNNNFSKILLRWSLAFVLFYGAILDLKTRGYFFSFLNFYFIFLAVWLFWGKKIVLSSYLTFLTFLFLGIYKIFALGFGNGFIDVALALVALALIGLIKNKN